MSDEDQTYMVNLWNVRAALSVWADGLSGYLGRTITKEQLRRRMQTIRQDVRMTDSEALELAMESFKRGDR